MIPNLCRQYLNNGRHPFYLYGDPYDTKDSSCMRDYIHTQNLVRAHWLAFEYIRTKVGCYNFNLRPGRGYSVKEVIAAFEKVTGFQLKVEVKPPRPGGPPSLIAKSANAQKELGFHTEFDPEDMILDTIQSMKARSY